MQMRVPLSRAFGFLDLEKPEASRDGIFEVLPIAEQSEVFIQMVDLMLERSVAVHDGQSQEFWEGLLLNPAGN